MMLVAPTCTTDGYTLHECACGDSYQDSNVSKLGHAYRQVSSGQRNGQHTDP